MKKYNIYDLKVVKVGTGYNMRYLICIYDKKGDLYIDVLTSKKIKINSDRCIEPLANYYYLENATEKQLMVGKYELIKKYREINYRLNLIHNERQENNSNYINYNDVLEKATINFFPKDGNWYFHCFKKPIELNKSNLPCHLRNDIWLAKMLKKDQDLNYISDNKVLNFITTSSFFKEKRHEYELEIVKWQILWMVRHGEKRIIDKNYGRDLVYTSPLVDLSVRKGIVDTLSKIGMNKDVIEEGLEKYADLWREHFMLMAFINELKPEFYLEKSSVIEYKEKWLKMRRCEYYQRHKNSVDLYGMVLSDMLMTNEEMLELKNYLDKKYQQWMQHIKVVKNSKKNNVKTLKK